MILTKKIELKLHPKHFKYLRKLGYKNLKVGEVILIPIEHLMKKSNLKIKVKCDICEKRKMLSYNKYNKNIKNQNYYSCSSKCAIKKIKKTNIDRYGVEFATQNKEIKNKIKQKVLERYRVENPMQNKNVKNKAKLTIKNRYGFESPIQNKELKDKIKQTNLNKYGVENVFQNKTIQQKIKQTNLDKYGVEYPQQNKEINEKKKQTNLNKYGVKNVSQNKEIHEKQQKSGFLSKNYKDTKLHYRGTYEKHFLDFCFKNNISVTNGPSVKYLFEGKGKYYHSDFYLEKHNLIIEIKSDYYYKKHLKKNQIKQKSCIQQGYNFIFIIDKNYKEFIKMLFR